MKARTIHTASGIAIQDLDTEGVVIEVPVNELILDLEGNVDPHALLLWTLTVQNKEILNNLRQLNERADKAMSQSAPDLKAMLEDLMPGASKLVKNMVKP